MRDETGRKGGRERDRGRMGKELNLVSLACMFWYRVLPLINMWNIGIEDLEDMSSVLDILILQYPWGSQMPFGIENTDMEMGWESSIAVIIEDHQYENN